MPGEWGERLQTIAKLGDLSMKEGRGGLFHGESGKEEEKEDSNQGERYIFHSIEVI